VKSPERAAGVADQRKARRRNCPSAGFTLLELLVALLVIAMLWGVAVLSIERGDESLELEATRLRGLLQLASEEAVLRARQYGLRIARDGSDPDRIVCEWMVLEEQRWQLLESTPFEAYRLPSELSIEVRLDGLDVAPAPAANAADANRIEPQLLFLSSGETSSYSIELRSEQEPDLWYRISADIAGKVELESNDARG
jgi:general secretion pathway protein H